MSWVSSVWVEWHSFVSQFSTILPTLASRALLQSWNKIIKVLEFPLVKILVCKLGQWLSTNVNILMGESLYSEVLQPLVDLVTLIRNNMSEIARKHVESLPSQVILIECSIKPMLKFQTWTFKQNRHFRLQLCNSIETFFEPKIVYANHNRANST